jgi:predicted RNA-binding Zn-ribbon protein involved in translation (DUF1610 family)
MTMIEFLIVSILFMAIGYKLGKNTQEEKPRDLRRIATSPPPMPRLIKVMAKNLKPRYHGYVKGTFANVNKCSNENCGLIGLYEDLHTANPCPECGAKVIRNGSAKWAQSPEFDNSFMWIKSNLNGDGV